MMTEGWTLTPPMLMLMLLFVDAVAVGVLLVGVGVGVVTCGELGPFCMNCLITIR